MTGHNVLRGTLDLARTARDWWHKTERADAFHAWAKSRAALVRLVGIETAGLLLRSNDHDNNA